MIDDAAGLPLFIDDKPHELMVFKFFDFALRFIASHLLIERIEQLLPGRCAAKGCAMIQGAAEPAKVEIAFGRPVECAAEPVHHPDNAGSSQAHFQNRRLVGEEVSSFNRVVGMDRGESSSSFEVHRGIDPALRADGMGPFDFGDGNDFDMASIFGQFHRCGKSCKPSSHDNDFLSFSCFILKFSQ